MKKMVLLFFMSSALYASDDVEVGAVAEYYPQNSHVVGQDTLEALCSLDLQQTECCASCRDCYTSCLNEGPVLCPQTQRESAFCMGGLIGGAFVAILCIFAGV